MKKFLAFIVGLAAGFAGVWFLHHQTGAGREALSPLVQAVSSRGEREAKTEESSDGSPEGEEETEAQTLGSRREQDAEPHSTDRPTEPAGSSEDRVRDANNEILSAAKELMEGGELARAFRELDRLREGSNPLPNQVARAGWARFYRLALDVEKAPDPPGSLVVLERKLGGTKILVGLLEETRDGYVVCPFGVSGKARMTYSRSDYKAPRAVSAQEKRDHLVAEIERKMADAQSTYDYYVAALKAIEYGLPETLPMLEQAAIAYAERHSDEDFWMLVQKEKSYVLGRRRFLYEASGDSRKAEEYRVLLVSAFPETEQGREASEPRSAGAPEPTEIPSSSPEAASGSPPPTAGSTPTSNPEVADLLLQADGYFDEAHKEIRLSLPGMEDCDRHLEKALTGFERALPLYEEAFRSNPENARLRARIEKTNDLLAHCHKFKRPDIR